MTTKVDWGPELLKRQRKDDGCALAGVDTCLDCVFGECRFNHQSDLNIRRTNGDVFDRKGRIKFYDDNSQKMHKDYIIMGMRSMLLKWNLPFKRRHALRRRWREAGLKPRVKCTEVKSKCLV